LSERSRILVVNANWVGDVLFSTPAIRAIRKRYPQAHLACLVPSRAAAVLAGNPRLDEVIPTDDDTSGRSFFRSLGLARSLGRRKFDTVFLFHRSRTKARVARWAGIRERVGFAVPGRSGLLTKAVPLPPEETHRIDFYLSLVQGAGIQANGRKPEFFPAESASGSLDRLFAQHGMRRDEPYVVVHAGGNWDLKRWPAEHFARWIRLFRQNRPWKVLLCGTASEAELADRIRDGFAPSEVVSLSGKTSLDELALLLRGARLLVSNDSGPIHLAASQDTPIVALFGPTSPERTGPVSDGRILTLRKDVGCAVPCYFRACDWRACMELLTPEEVLERSLSLCA